MPYIRLLGPTRGVKTEMCNILNCQTKKQPSFVHFIVIVSFVLLMECIFSNLEICEAQWLSVVALYSLSLVTIQV